MWRLLFKLIDINNSKIVLHFKSELLASADDRSAVYTILGVGFFESSLPVEIGFSVITN